MSKTDTRLSECYGAIRRALPGATADADNAIRLVEKHVELFVQRGKIATLLSLGSRTDKSQAETERREAVRCCALLDMVVGGQPAGFAEMLLTRHGGKTIAQLNQHIVGSLPLFDPSPLRAQWAATNFDHPNLGRGDYNAAQPNAPIAPFRYFVFGMMNTAPVAGTSYTQILANPQMVDQFLLSTSIITNGKVACYYPYGLILIVPHENIVSTHHKDTSTRNYNTVVQNEGEALAMAELRANDLRANVRNVSARFPLRTPDDILNATTGTQGMQRYNEIAVLGSYGSRKITVVGFFKKVNAAGRNYIRADSGATYVTPAIDQAIAQTGLPVIRLLDTSGLDQPKPGKT